MKQNSAMSFQEPPDKSVKIAELKRELKKRESVYPRQIKAKTLSRDRANRQYWVLKCILEDYTGVGTAQGQQWVPWTCPVCNERNSSVAGEEIVYCEHGQGCKQGPFYLSQDPARRAMKTEIVYVARKIEGLPYKEFQRQEQAALL